MKIWITTLKTWITTLTPDLSRIDSSACLATGVLLALCFPPFNLWLLSVIALVPMLTRLKFRQHRHNAQLGFWSGIVFYSLLLYWLINVTLPGMILLILVLSVLFALATTIIGLTWHPVLRVLTTALIITFFEYMRSLGPFAFAWGYLGHSLYAQTTLIQSTYWFGVYGLTFLIAASNQAISELIHIALHAYHHRCKRILFDLSAGYTYLNFGLVILLWLGNAYYGQQAIQYTQNQYADAQPVRVGLIQPNFQQDEKESASTEVIMAKCMTLTEAAAKQNPDLIIWPESTIPVPLNYWPSVVNELVEFTNQTNTEILMGTVYGKNHPDNSWDFWNRAILFSPGQSFPWENDEMNMSIAQSYDKMHLVPYGEWVPLGEYWPMNLIETLIEEAGAGIFQRGTKQTIFKMDEGQQFAVAICYESSLAARLSRAKDKGAMFLVNITNDAWFKRSPGLMQHFILSIFRAAENRIPVVRVGNTGVSGVIGPTGELIAVLPDNKTDYRVVEFKINK